MNDQPALGRGAAKWGGTFTILAVCSFWGYGAALDVLHVSPGPSVGLTILYFPYVLGIPILGFVTLFNASAQVKRLGRTPTPILIQALLAFCSIGIWFWSIAARVVEIP